MAEQIRIIELTPGEGLVVTVGGERVFVKAVDRPTRTTHTTTVLVDAPTEGVPHPPEPEIWKPGPGDHVLAVHPVATGAGTVRAARLPAVAHEALAEAARTLGTAVAGGATMPRVVWQDQAWPET